MISDKIRPHHLERKAILYVRRSSAHQEPGEQRAAIRHARSPDYTWLVRDRGDR